jgi:hypothetical protein
MSPHSPLHHRPSLLDRNGLVSHPSTNAAPMASSVPHAMLIQRTDAHRGLSNRSLPALAGLMLGCWAVLLGMDTAKAQSSSALPTNPLATSSVATSPYDGSNGSLEGSNYRRIFVHQADLPELALDGFRPIEVDQLIGTLEAHEQAVAPKLSEGEAASNGIASFHAIAKLIGADLLSDRSRIGWEPSRDARGNPLKRVSRTLLSPWSLALDNPIFKIQDTSQTVVGPSFGFQTPAWVFDDLGRPTVRNDNPEEWFTWSLRPIKDSSPNRLNYALSIPRTPNSCLVLQLPKGARVADASVVARPVDVWNDVLARVGRWPTNPTLPESVRDSAPSDIFWILELSGQEQASFSVLLGSSGAGTAIQGDDPTTSYTRLIARQSVQYSIASDVLRTVGEWEWTEFDNVEGPLKLRLPASARLKSLTVNDREPDLQFSERVVEIALPTVDAASSGVQPGTTTGAKMRLNVELLTPLPAHGPLTDTETPPRSIAIEPIDLANAYVVAGTMSLIPMSPLQIHGVTTSAGRLEGARMLPHGGFRLDYSWFQRLPATTLLTSPLPLDQRAEIITRLSTDSDRVSAAVRMQLSPWKDPQPREIRIASDWRLDSAQLNTKSIAMQSLDKTPSAPTVLRLESLSPNDTTPIQLELQLSRELPTADSLRLDSEPLLELPAWKRSDALILEPNPAMRLEMDANTQDWSLDEETLTPWQKDRLPRLGKYLILRMDGGVLPPLRPRSSTAILSASIDSRLRSMGNQWAIEHHIQLPANLSKRDSLSIRVARDAHWNLQTASGPRVPRVRYDSDTERWIIDPAVLIERDDRTAPIRLVATHAMPTAARMEFDLPTIDGALIANRTCSADAGLELTSSDRLARWEFDPFGNAQLRWPPTTYRMPTPSVRWVGQSTDPLSASWISHAQLDVAIDPSGSQKASLFAHVLTVGDTLDLRFDAPQDWQILQATRIDGASPNTQLRVDRVGQHIHLQGTLKVSPIAQKNGPPASSETQITTTNKSSIAEIEVILVGPTRTVVDRPLLGLLPRRTIAFAWPDISFTHSELQLQRNLWVAGRVHVERQATSNALVVSPDGPLPPSNATWWTLWAWSRETMAGLGWPIPPATPAQSEPTLLDPSTKPPRNLVPGWMNQEWRVAHSDAMSSGSAHDSTTVILRIGADTTVALQAALFALAVVLTPWLLRFHAWWCFALAILASIAGHWCVESYAVLARSLLVGVGMGTILYQFYVIHSTRDRRRGPKVHQGDRWLPWNEPALGAEPMSEGSHPSRHGSKAGPASLLFLAVSSPWWWSDARLPVARGQDPADRVPRTMQRLVDVMIPIDDEGGLAGTVVYVPEWMLRDIERMENAEKVLDRDASLLSAKHVLRLDSRSIDFGNTDQACVHTYEFWVGDQALDRPLRIPFQADRTRLSRFTVDGTEVISSRLARSDSELIWYPDRVGRRLLQVEAQTRVRPIELERPGSNPGLSSPSDPKQPRAWNVETAILPCANAILEIETDGQWTIDLSARGKLANPSIGRFALHLGNLDRISGSVSPSPTNSARPFIAMPSDTPSLNTEIPIMNTELFIDREQLMAKTTLEYPRSTETLGELELESDQQWQPIGSIWGDAQLVDVKPGSTLDRKRYVLRWIPETTDTNPTSTTPSTALPTKRSIVTTWIPIGDTPLRNVLFAECRDRRVRSGTLRYARTAGSAWTIDGINTWIPSINARERIEWPELSEKPIATSLKIPVSGGFGVLRQQLDAKPIRARVTNQWWIDRDATSLRSKLEFSSPVTNKTSLRLQLPEGFKAAKATSRNSAIAFSQWAQDGLNHLQLWIDRDTSEMSELTITCDNALFDSKRTNLPVPSIYGLNLVAQEQITEIAADPFWSLRLGVESDAMPVRGRGPSMNVLSVPFSLEQPEHSITRTRCEAPWTGMLIVHPQDAAATGSDWELRVLVDRTPTMRPQIEVSIPMPWAARWSTAQPSQENLDLNLQRRILSLRPDLHIDAPQLAMTVAWNTEAKQIVSPQLASQVLAIGNPDMACWFAIYREDADTFDTANFERLEDAIAQPWLALAGLQQHVLIRPTPPSRVAPTSSSPNAPIEFPSSAAVTLAPNESTPMSAPSLSSPSILLATHAADTLRDAPTGRAVVRSTFWIAPTSGSEPVLGARPWRWSLPDQTHCEWVRFNGESVPFHVHEGQLEVAFNAVHCPIVAEIWTSIPATKPNLPAESNWIDTTPTSLWATPSTTYWLSPSKIERRMDNPEGFNLRLGDVTSGEPTEGIADGPSSFLPLEGLSPEAWIATQATAWLDMLAALQSSESEPENPLPTRFSSGTLGRWHRFFAEQTLETMAVWAMLPTLQQSTSYAAAVARWQDLRAHLPEGTIRLEGIIRPKGSIAHRSSQELRGHSVPMAPPKIFDSQSNAHSTSHATAPLDPQSMAAGRNQAWWSEAFAAPRLTRLIASLSTVLTIVLLAWLWQSTKHWLIQSPWWHLVGVAALLWILTGWILPALIPIAMGLIVSIDSYWMINERFRQTAIRGPR